MRFSNNVVCVWYVTCKGSVQPMQMHSLIRDLLILEYAMAEQHNFQFVSLKGDCTGSTESTLVKIPHCWKFHVITQPTLSIRIELISQSVRLASNSGTPSGWMRLMFCNNPILSMFRNYPILLNLVMGSWSSI